MWQLLTDQGQQVWQYVRGEKNVPLPPYDVNKNPNSGDKVYRDTIALSRFKALSEKQMKDLKADATHTCDFSSSLEQQESLETLLKAVNYYKTLQMDDGHFPGDYGGPMFLMPGLIITCYVTGTQLDEQVKLEMIRYLWNHQSKDGGWGIHIEEKCTMFGTVLTYVSLRLLGVPADEPRLQPAKQFIHANGGAMACPSWGKFWLCVLGVYDWSGINSLFPELWLLPEALPFHPSRWWCHCRMVYLPMAYCYGHRVTGKITSLVKQLRNELYPMTYETIEFSRYRSCVNPAELYTPETKILKVLNFFTNAYEKFAPQYFRQKSLDFLLSYIHAEDDQTNYVDIGPVNKFVNMLSVWHACGPNSREFELHKSRVNDYLWLAEDGMKCQGYNGSQLWDTAFAIQALDETGLSYLYKDTLKLGYHYLEISQVLEDVRNREKFYRHISKGGWPFSTRAHGWPISDCTAEGLKATLLLHDSVITAEKDRLIDAQRQQDAVNVILSFQNTDGGWATYENTRGPAWLEYINPAEVFGGIMIDYSYTECTSASIQALCYFRERQPSHRRDEVSRSISRGMQFIRSQQRADGSWYGSWAVCFTYAAWFAIDGLITAGESTDSPVIQKGVKFLLSKQHADGGWGESYKSCVTKQYVQKDTSQVVNTAWALLSLMKAEYHLTDRSVIERGIAFLRSKQTAIGDWEQEGISGVFNGNCMITYINYRNIFPIWALGRWLQCNKK